MVKKYKINRRRERIKIRTKIMKIEKWEKKSTKERVGVLRRSIKLANLS